MHTEFEYQQYTKTPCYRREDRAMPLSISVRIKGYSGIARFSAQHGFLV